MKNRLHQLAAAALMTVASMGAQAAFDITVNYSGDSAYQSYFDNAASFWEGLITGYQGSVSLTGVTIDASIEAIDGQWGTLGYAGPNGTSVQGGFRYTTTGIMVFDSADMAYMTGSGTFADVIRHEMAHVLGFGTLWTYNGVYVDGSGQYTGAAALAEYQTEYNQPGATYIPVELGGGGGTADGHWNEVDNGAGTTGITDGNGNDMRNELMTGWLNAPTYVSRTTIAQFQDIGYTVNLSPVPEPETMMMFALGLPVLLRFARRQNKPQA
ncbi:MAG: PEP-CTERM sorting domain-containing protein [Burkholderiaceae bacterium]|nr:PEP-CTERM sorting domain-containing protein [Burkholderiaceae bacterium]